MKLLCLLLAAVSANAATSLDVQMPHSSTTGIAFNFTVTALNSGATDTSYAGTVHFTSDDPKAVLPPDYTFVPGDAGTHTFSATMNSAGPSIGTANHTLTAIDTANNLVRGVNGTTVHWNDNVVRMFDITAPTTVDRTVPFQVEVRALNASLMMMPSYTGTIRFRAVSEETVPPDYTFTPADAGRHTFSITANRGHVSQFGVFDISDSDVFGGDLVDVQCPELVAFASNNGPVCPHSSAMLFGSANLPVISYAWAFLTPSGHMPLVSTDQNTVGSPGMHFLTVTQSNGCMASAQTTVAVHDPIPPQVTLSSNAICGTGNLRATITNASVYSSSSLNWTATGGTIVGGQGTPSVEVAPDSGSTLIRLSLGATETSSGCDASRSVADVPVGSGGTPAISTSAMACGEVSQSASVADAGTGAVYAWTISNGAITGGAGTRTIQYVPNGSGDVTLSATVTNGSCNGTGSAVVPFAETPQITEQPHGTTVRSGETATLTVAASGGSLLYRWYEGSAGNRTKLVGFGTTYTTKPLSATASYWVAVENNCGIEPSVTAVVTVSNGDGKRRAVRH